MKKIISIFVTFIIVFTLLTGCKKKSNDTASPSLTLAISNNSFGTINSCTWQGNNQTNKGTPFNISFTVTDPSGIMQKNTWQLFEQIGTQPAMLGLNGNPLSGGNTFSKQGGCITFGAFSSFTFKYYVVSNGITSNTVSVTVNKPAGAF